MRMSRLLAPTLRQVPAEAGSESHRLMLRAGLMRRVAAGVYSYLPLGQRAIAKVEAIAREEMDRLGAQEVRLPLLQPEELWERGGRAAGYGDELWRLHDRHGRPFVLAPAQAEVVADLVRREVSSWRQLPMILYHVSNQYRDEARPRSGSMRAREFVMKDAYSLDPDRAGLAAAHARVREAYARLCTRCGLQWRLAEAGAGTIGGSDRLELVALADGGDAEIVCCDGCGYAANVDKAEAAAPAAASAAAEGAAVPAAAPEALEAATGTARLHTPGVRTIEDLVAFTGVPASGTSKILFLWAEYAPAAGVAAGTAAVSDGPAAAGTRAGRRELVAALVRGDRQLNETKLGRVLGALRLTMADRADVRALTGAPVGSAGPVGLHGARLLTDLEIACGRGFIVGANEEDWHLLGAKAGRDFDPGQVADLRRVGDGDPCPRCGRPLRAARGYEVGHMFALGTVYSQAMGALYRDERGGSHPIEMGCYGIGITRTVAAVIERHHDRDGIVWPFAVAPYHVAVVPVAAGDDGTRAAGERLYAELRASGVEAVLDDRDERPGVKFKDADLLGWPLRVTVGRSLRDGAVELRRREDGRTDLVELGAAAAVIRARVAEGLAPVQPPASVAPPGGPASAPSGGSR